MKISVVIPLLNAKEYLRECVESVLSQTYEKIEIICVDAGSTDGTLEMLEAYENNNVNFRVLKSPVKSYGFQVNMGIDASDGDYIGIVEADDVISPNMYEKLASYAMKYRADFIKESYYQMSTCSGEKLVVPANREVDADIKNKVLYLDDNNHMMDLNHIWSGIYSRDFLSKNCIRFNETPGASYQDTSFSVLTDLLAETAVYTGDMDYYYRIDNDGSSVKSNEKYACIVDEVRYIESETKRRGLYTRFEKEIIKHRLFVYNWNYHRLSDDGRRMFSAMVKDELADIERCFDVLGFSLAEKKIIDNISNNRHEDIDASLSEYYRILEILKTNKNVVLFGAGVWGESILLVQRVYRLDAICDVIDNDENKHGKTIFGYSIEKPDRLILDGRDKRFLIANKYHARDIEEQLIKAGIAENRIERIIDAPSFVDIVENYRRQGSSGE